MAIGQALAGANSTVVYATGAIVGNMLAPDKALATLPMRFRRAVELYWIWGDEDAELSVLGRKCAVDYRTFGARVIEGHALLKAELARAAEAWRQHRERSEAAVSLARPMGGVLT